MKMRALVAAAILAASFSADAATQRSRSAVNAFKKMHPCPSTGKPRGPCPGWEVDHRTPLKCGGADHHSNMQWLTVPQHKAKTRREARWCRRDRAA